MYSLYNPSESRKDAESLQLNRQKSNCLFTVLGSADLFPPSKTKDVVVPLWESEMVDAIANVVSLDAFTVEIELFVRDSTHSGLKEIFVLDNFARLVKEEHVQGCPDEVVVSLDRLPRSRLPLRVEGQLCTGPDDETTPFLIEQPILSSLRITNDAGSLICRDDPTFRFCPPNPACDQAILSLRTARSSISEQCTTISRVRTRRDAAAVTTAAIAAAFAATLAAAISAFGIPIFGAVIGAVLLGVAAGLAYLTAVYALIANREQQKLDQEMATLEARRATFSSAVEHVSRNCCRHCHSEDLAQPVCQ